MFKWLFTFKRYKNSKKGKILKQIANSINRYLSTSTFLNELKVAEFDADSNPVFKKEDPNGEINLNK